jgi:hypothetical protein
VIATKIWEMSLILDEIKIDTIWRGKGFKTPCNASANLPNCLMRLPDLFAAALLFSS